MSNAESLNGSDRLFLPQELKAKAEKNIAAWKASQSNPEDIARADDILRRALSNEGITGFEARVLKALDEEGERLLQGATEGAAARKDWWRLRKKDDGTLEEKVLPKANDPSLRVTTETVDENGKVLVSSEKTDTISKGEKVVRKPRWTREQRSLMNYALGEILKRDDTGKNMLEAMREILRNDGAIIDERTFFDPHGAYAEMVPDEHQIMLNIVSEFRKLPTSADSRKQEMADWVEERVKRWKAGAMSRSDVQELETEIEIMKDEIKASQGEEAAVEEDAVVEESSDSTTAGTRKLRRTLLINRRWPDKWQKVKDKDEMSRDWKMDRGKIYSLFTEESDVLYSNLLQWDGAGTRSWMAADYDDKRHAADVVKTAQRVIEETIGGKKVQKTLTQEYIVNTTDGAEYGIQKTANTLRFIDFTFLSTLDFGVTSADIHGVESQGKHRLVPHLNYVISRPLTAELVLLHKHERYDILALHPVQLMRLKQAQAQVNAFLEYINTEYARNSRSRSNKNKVRDAFTKLSTLFAEVISERENLLKGALQGLRTKKAAGSLSETENDILEILEPGEVLWTRGPGNEYGELYDEEHRKYVRVFRPDRTKTTIRGRYKNRSQAWWRLMALTEKYPPVLTDDRTRKKVPVPSNDKIADDKVRGDSGKLRRTPRGEGFLARTKDVAKPSPVMPTDFTEGTDA